MGKANEEKNREVIDRGDLLEGELEDQELDEEIQDDELVDDDNEDENEVEEDEDLADEDDEEALDDEDLDDNDDDNGGYLEDETELSGSDERKRDIPLPRFNEVIAQRDKAREQNEQLMAQVEQLISMVGSNSQPAPDNSTNGEKKEEPAVLSYDFDQRERDYIDATLLGEEETALAIRKEIRQKERELFQLDLEETAKKASSVASEETRRINDEAVFTAMVQKFETEYPFLDTSNTEEFNEEAVSRVNYLMDTFTAAGKPKSEALVEAVELVVPLYSKPSAPAATKKGLGGKSAKRRKRQVSKNAKALKRQPNRMRGRSSVDKSIDEYDITKMTDAEFNKLPASVKRQLRGDA